MLDSCEHGDNPPAPCMMDNFLSSFLRKAVFHGVSWLIQKLILFLVCVTNILPEMNFDGSQAVRFSEARILLDYFRSVCGELILQSFQNVVALLPETLGIWPHYEIREKGGLQLFGCS